ncbi:MAG: hypothetical protein ACYC6A_09080 [Armatimonadota bacterium]
MPYGGASHRNIRHLVWRAIAPATDCAASETTALESLECPFTGTVVGAGARNDTAGSDTGGAKSTYDIRLDGTSIFSTRITIDTDQTSSRAASAPPVLATTAVTAGQVFSLYCTGVGSTPPKGLSFTIDVQKA